MPDEPTLEQVEELRQRLLGVLAELERRAFATGLFPRAMMASIHLEKGREDGKDEVEKVFLAVLDAIQEAADIGSQLVACGRLDSTWSMPDFTLPK